MEQLSALLLQAKPQPESIHDDHTTRKLTPSPQKTPASPPMSRPLPQAFNAPNFPAANCVQQLSTDLVNGSPQAAELTAQWEALAAKAAAREPATTLPSLATEVAAFSQKLYLWLATHPELSEDELLQAGSAWRQAAKGLYSDRFPKLEIKEVTPGDRFDSHFMQTVKDGPGNHLNVAAVHSWTLIDRSSERAQVLERAQISTN
jgi:hypothetical protein